MKQQIRDAYERGQQRYPTVQLPAEVFEERVTAILSLEMHPSASDGPDTVFKRMHHEDLFLAMACACGDRIAWEHFADEYLPLLRNFALHISGNPAESEDLAQEIAAKLLNDTKRLAGYNGRGSLAAWLRVAVSHAAVDRYRRAGRQTSLEGLQENAATAALVDPGKQDEDDAPDSRWGGVITDLANACLRSLPARDRLMLALYYLEGIPLKEIARQYGVHEATAYRWLDKTRGDIRKQVERELRKKHRLRPAEIQSLWKWVSPSSLAESIVGDSRETEAARNAGETVRKKDATGENSSVIRKEGLR